MKKYSKILTLLIALVMVISIFSGFTYAPIQSVAMGDHNGHVHTVAVDNLAVSSCTACGGDGEIIETVRCGACSDCLGALQRCQNPITQTTSCSVCGGDGSIGSPDPVPDPVPTASPSTPPITPAPTTSPAPAVPVITISKFDFKIIDAFVGDVVTITCNATVTNLGSNTISYQWFYDDVAGSVPQWIACENGNDKTYTIPTKIVEDGGLKCVVTVGSVVATSDVVGISVTEKSQPLPSPTVKPVDPVKTSNVEFHLIDNLKYSNDSKLFFNMNAPTDIKLGDFKTKFLNTNNLVKGFYSWDVFGYHKVNDYDKITSSGTSKIYMLVDNVNLILDVQAPTLENPITIVKKQSIKVDFVVDGKIFTTINVLESEVPNTSYFIEPPFNLTKTFQGWGLKADAIDVISATWKPTANTTLYAIYSATVVEKTSNTLIIIVVVAVVLVLLFVIYSVFGKKNYRR